MSNLFLTYSPSNDCPCGADKFLEILTKYLIKIKLSKYAVVSSKGKNLDHPHIHAWLTECQVRSDQIHRALKVQCHKIPGTQVYTKGQTTGFNAQLKVEGQRASPPAVAKYLLLNASQGGAIEAEEGLSLSGIIDEFDKRLGFKPKSRYLTIEEFHRSMEALASKHEKYDGTQFSCDVQTLILSGFSIIKIDARKRSAIYEDIMIRHGAMRYMKDYL